MKHSLNWAEVVIAIPSPIVVDDHAATGEFTGRLVRLMSRDCRRFLHSPLTKLYVVEGETMEVPWYSYTETKWVELIGNWVCGAEVLEQAKSVKQIFHSFGGVLPECTIKLVVGATSDGRCILGAY